MYIVTWENPDGLHNEQFDELIEAKLEAESLKEVALHIEIRIRKHLYCTRFKDNRTEEILNIRVWAQDTYDAYRQLNDILFGADREYQWLGTEPVYEDNHIITKEVEIWRFITDERILTT